MSVLYQHLSDMSDAGLLDENGKPKLDEEGKPLAWSSGDWGGRQCKGENGGGEEGAQEGRNFKTGKAFLDPNVFGVTEDDPNYQDYLSGAKLPPGYLEMMEKYKKGELNGDTLNNLKQTNFGNYGRQAEKPKAVPSWASGKLKLKKTNQGSMIRQGQYDDSPSKVVNRFRKSGGVVPDAPTLQDSEGSHNDSNTSLKTPSTEENPPAPQPQNVESKEQEVKVDAAQSSNTGYQEPERNKVYASTEIQSDITKSPSKVDSPVKDEDPVEPRPKKYNFNHFYYNASAPAPAPVTKQVSETPPAKVEKAEDVGSEEEEEYEELVEEYSEYEDDEETEEPNHFEAAVPTDAGSSTLTDLQAILAEKQAELRRLQGLSS